MYIYTCVSGHGQKEKKNRHMVALWYVKGRKHEIGYLSQLFQSWKLDTRPDKNNVTILIFTFIFQPCSYINVLCLNIYGIN